MRVVLISAIITTAATLWAVGCGDVQLQSFELAIAGYVMVSAAAMGVALRRRSNGLQIGVISAALAGFPVLWTAERLLHIDASALGCAEGMFPILTATIALTIVGLQRRKLWGLWLAWAGGAAGLLSATINGIASLAVFGVWTWGHAIVASCCLLVFAGLTDASVRAEFENSEATDPVWQSSDRVVRGLRWAVLSNLVATPMLLVYALAQPIVPATVTSALILAVVLVVAVTLTLASRAVGAVLLTVAGPALIAQAAVTMASAADHAYPMPEISYYYGLFWIPAGVLSTVTGAILITRRLRRP